LRDGGKVDVNNVIKLVRTWPLEERAVLKRGKSRWGEDSINQALEENCQKLSRRRIQGEDPVGLVKVGDPDCRESGGGKPENKNDRGGQKKPGKILLNLLTLWSWRRSHKKRGIDTRLWREVDRRLFKIISREVGGEALRPGIISAPATPFRALAKRVEGRNS